MACEQDLSTLKPSKPLESAPMQAIPLLLLYSLIIIAASLLGGWLPSRFHMTHTRTQVMLSFVAGLMLGVAMYHLLPHAIATLDNDGAVEHAVWWLMVGLLMMFILLRAFHFHQHDHSVDEHDHHHHHHPLSWTGIALGLGLHTLIDGIALGAAIQADVTAGTGTGLFGLGVFLAIVLHKPIDAMSITALMKSSGWKPGARLIVNGVFSLLCPIGALLFFWGVGNMGDQQSIFIGSALAFSAGVFLCISLSDLLPEIQFHTHDRTKLTLSLLAGVALAYSIGFVEPSHAHHDDDGQADLHQPAP